MATRSKDLLVGNLGGFTLAAAARAAWPRTKPGNFFQVVSRPTIGACGKCTDCTCITAEPTSCGPDSVDINCPPCSSTHLALATLHIELARMLMDQRRSRRGGTKRRKARAKK